MRIERKLVDDTLVRRILATEDTEKTVPVPLNGEAVHTVRSRYYHHIWLKYRVRVGSKLHGDVLHVWLPDKGAK